MGHVFVSYSRADKEKVIDFLCPLLQRFGIKLWVDTEDIPGGEVWNESLKGAIETCDVLLQMLSNSSKDSEWVRQERNWADQFNRKIIPVVIEPGEYGEDVRQRIDLTPNFSKNFNRLLMSLGINKPKTSLSSPYRIIKVKGRRHDRFAIEVEKTYKEKHVVSTIRTAAGLSEIRVGWLLTDREVEDILDSARDVGLDVSISTFAKNIRSQR